MVWAMTKRAEVTSPGHGPIDDAVAAPHDAGGRSKGLADRATVEIVVPVHNEQRVLSSSITRLHTYLTDRFPLPWTITIVDNASTDATWALARGLSEDLPGVSAMHLDAKGRGRALRAAWSRSSAAIVAYLDVDLSTDLDALYPLISPLVTGHSGVAIGTRLATGARVVRGPRREVISRTYNFILHHVLRCHFSDAQCGFKALRHDVAAALVPLVEDQSWFFDTELLVLAERNGIRIHEVPVDWVDDPDSRVDVVRTALDDLRGVLRLLGCFARGGGRIEPGRSAAPVGPTVDVPEPGAEGRPPNRPAPIERISA